MEVEIITSPGDFLVNEVIKYLPKGCNIRLIKYTYGNVGRNKLSFNLSNDEAFHTTRKVVWFRKFPDCSMSVDGDKIQIKKFLVNELTEFIKSYYYHCIYNENISVLGTTSFGYQEINKIHSLLIARKVGLNIPTTLVSNQESETHKFIQFNDEIIAKPISQSTIFYSDSKNYVKELFTTKVDKNKITNFSFPNKLQILVDRIFDIRIFYINGFFFHLPF